MLRFFLPRPADPMSTVDIPYHVHVEALHINVTFFIKYRTCQILTGIYLYILDHTHCFLCFATPPSVTSNFTLKIQLH